MNIFSQLKTLNLPQGAYCVIGGGVMAAHGIRDTKDIDLLVTQELYMKLKEDGWKEKRVNEHFVTLEHEIFEASPDMVTLPNYKPDTNRLIKEAEIINGIPFTSLEDVIDFKKALGREKDLRDIELIKQYLNKYPKS